jgi:hypothetical protein
VSVASGNGVFVAAGQSNFCWSTNGTDWTAAQPGPEQWVNPWLVRYGGGTFVAVCQGGGILSSADGQNWVSHNSGTTLTLNGVAYGAGVYVVVGDCGVVLASSAAAPWSLRMGPVDLLPGGACAVTIEGAAGHNWELQASTNLVNWTPLLDLFSTNTSLQFIDADATKYSRRFYRARGW